MANVLIGWPNRIDQSTLSGGAWAAALPLDNLKVPRMPVVARSTDALTASTQFDADLGASKTLLAIAIANHNLSQDAEIRVSLGSTSGDDDVYAGDWTPAYAITFGSGTDEWADYEWFTGLSSDEWIGTPFTSFVLLPSAYAARYVRVEIDDTTNPDGYVQMGRVFIGSGFVPAFNPAYGLQDGFRDPSLITELESGAVIAHPRRRLRTVKFALELVRQDDEFSILHELQRRIGTVGEVLYVPNYRNAEATQRTGFIGRMSKLDPISYPIFRHRSAGFEIVEIL